MKKYLFIVLILKGVFLFAQQYNFHNYSVKDGVAQSQVYALLQDSRGYLWMGTQGGGITSFDGINFKTYTVKDGLTNNYISCVKEDAKHNLWIGTMNGVCMYNGLEFKKYKLVGDSAQLSIKSIDFDNKGRKWLATNVGVLFLDDKGITNVSELLKDKKTVVTSLLVDSQNNVWYGNADGLYKITEVNNVFQKIKFDKSNGFTNNSIPCIKQDAKGNLWIGTYGDGVYVYDGNRFYKIDLNLELYKQTILDCYFDKHDNVWLATLNHGVAQYNTLSKSFSFITENEGLSNNHVRSIIQDKSGNYWFGTSGGGVCNYFGKQFTVFDKSSGLGGNFIYSIFRDNKQRLWVGTSDKGVSVFDSSRFTNYNAAKGFADVKVKAINEDNNGNIYFGTDGQGVFVSNDGFSFKAIDELNKKYIRAIVKDKNGDLWIATAGAGLYKLVLKDSPILINYTVKEGLLHPRLTALHYDKQGRLWYATENNGIGFIENDKVKKPVFTGNDKLPASSIRCFAEDNTGYLWAGTGGDGLLCFPLYHGDLKLKRYDHTNGLTSSNIYLVSCDKANNLFVGTETGLDHIYLDKERKPKEIKHYSKGEGFTGIETCQNSVFNDDDGTIWFGTINGLTKYDPSNLVKNQNEPVTTITDVKLFNTTISKTEYKNFTGDWNTISDLKLPYDQNNLSFDFTGINFSNPDAVRYKWKLEGSDKSWSPVTAQKNVNYSNLGGGDYTFMVMACNEDGVWNEQPVIFKFHISLPFWKRWWFIVLILAFGFGAVFAVFRWRLNSIRSKAAETQKKLQLEKEVVELEQKALRLQMNPHFIFNALNSIQSQIGTDNEQAARYYLAKFSRLMRQILDNSRSTSITLEEEVNTLENYLLIEKFCNGDRFDYKIIVDEAIEKDYVKIPPMLLQPFIENAIKHGLKYIDGKKGLIEVNFVERNNILECSVTDNGIGRVKAEELNKNSKETYHRSTALIVTRERLDLLKEDNGICSLEIIDLYDEQNNATGTKIIVRIPIA
ncbi:MAG: histidine kinase [Bacteroidetes bacterium]|nr:histidine kinase [Bacteroidota bacterium]